MTSGPNIAPIWPPFDKNWGFECNLKPSANSKHKTINQFESPATMEIIVKGYLTLKPIIGGPEEIRAAEQGWTLEDLLRYLAAKHGDAFCQAVFDGTTNALSPHAKILVNGRHYSHLPMRLETQLHDGDEVSLFPMVAGG